MTDSGDLPSSPSIRPSWTGQPRVGRWIARVISSAFAGVGLLPFVVAGLLETNTVKTWSSKLAAEVIKDETGLDCSLDVSVRLWPLAVTVDGVLVHATDGDDPALEVDRVTLRPKFFSLLQGRPNAGDIEVEHPRVRLVVNDSKISNLDLRLSSAEPESEPMESAPFTSVSINDAHVDVTFDGTRIVGGDIDIDVSAGSGPSFEIAMRTGKLDVDSQSRLAFIGYGAPDPVQAVFEDTLCELDARVLIEPQSVLVRRLRVMGAVDLAHEAGTRKSCEMGANDLHRLDVELRQVRAAFDSDGLASVKGHARARSPLLLANRFMEFLMFDGWVGASVDGEWHRGQKLPDIHAEVHGERIALGVYRVANSLDLTGGIEAGVVRVPRARIGFGDGIVTIHDGEAFPLEDGVPLRVPRMDVEHLMFPGLMRDLDVTAHTVVRMDIYEATYTSIEGTIVPLHIDSDLIARVKDFEVLDSGFDDPAARRVLGVPLGVVKSKFAVRPNAIEFQNARIEFANSRLNVFTSLGFNDDFRLVAYGDSMVQLEDINPLLDIPWKGKTDLAVDIGPIYSRPLIRGDVSIEGFEFAGMAFGEVRRGTILFTPMVMDIVDVQVEKGSSSYQVPSLRVDFTGPTPVVVDGRVEASRLDLREFLAIFGYDKDPRFDGLYGIASAKASVHLEQGGGLDKCGDGWLGVRVDGALRQLELYGERFDSGSFELDYEWFDREAQELGLRVDVNSFLLRKGEGTIMGQAAIRPGGQLDARAVASNIPISSLDAFGSFGTLLDGQVFATAHVGGTIDMMEADVDARVGPLRIGSSVLPSSWIGVRLSPVGAPARTIGRTKCGNPITPPFDPVAYAKDLPTGVFNVRGELLGGQVTVPNFQISRQSSKVASGTIVANDLDLGKIAQAMPAIAHSEERPQGLLNGQIEVRHMPFDRIAEADASVSISSLELGSRSGIVRLSQGTSPIELRGDTLNVPGIQLDYHSTTGLSGAFLAGGQIRHISTKPELDLHTRLSPIDLSALANMIPGVDRARGIVEASIDITGQIDSPSYRGQLTVKDGAVSMSGIPGMPMPIDGIDVLVRVDERQITLERAHARAGGGTLSATGSVAVDGFGLGAAFAVVAAREITLSPIDGVKTTLDADISALWDARMAGSPEGIPRVVGDVTLKSLEYSRPFGIEADIASIAERVRKTTVELYDPEQDLVDFDVRIHAIKPVRIRNNIADMRLVLDTPVLVLSGSNQRVGLVGALRVQPRSRIRLRSSEFEVRDGLIRFDDPTRIAPILDITAVTEYRRFGGSDLAVAGSGASGGSGISGVSRSGGHWRIQLHAHGDTDNLRLDMTSEPALSQEDIVLVLMLGVTRAELDQMQASSLGETAALEALSTLTGADSVVRETVPVIDDFRFGSAYSSRSGRTESTVTVGKRLTERVRANVTSGLSDTREVRSNVEWELTSTTSLLGGWDNANNVANSSLGNLGGDIRFRIIFR
ncbi:MAG: translocation/assembly module TamB domain-containing protein [Polyangiaceae bacterium]|nr:translocation/assembly module TamB domain-containing protein [Polyangiaceae bacterium]